MAKSSFSKAEVLILMNGKQPADVLDGLKKRADEARKKLEEMGDVSSLDEAQLNTYRELQDELAATSKAAKALERDMLDINQVVANLSTTSMEKLQKAAKALRREIRSMSEEDMKELPKKLADLTAIENQMAKLNEKIKQEKESLTPVPDLIAQQAEATESVIGKFGKYLAMIAGAGAALDAMSEAFDLNLDLSDTLSDVQKATGLTADEVNRLSTALEGLDTRTTLTGLNELAYAGGRMGIQGAENLYQFVKAADQLNVALAEDLGDGAIETLTKMADVMGLIDEMGYEKALLSVGSAINTLTASSVASGEPIVDMLSRLAGVGVSSKLTTEELLALSAASDAAGLTAETAATSLSQFIVKLKTDSDTVAKAAGISADALKKLLDEGKTMDAVVSVFEGLSSRGGIEALAPVMKDLGGAGSRAITVISTLVNNVDNLKAMLDISKTSFEEATSVTDEFNVKNENAAALVERMKNAFEETFVNSRVVQGIESWLRELMKIPQVVEQNKVTIITAVSAISLALLSLNARLIGFAFARRLVMLRTALKSLWAIITANPWIAAGAGIALVITKIVDYNLQLNESEKAHKRLKTLHKEYNESLNKETTHVSQLFSWLQKAEKGTAEYEKAKMAIQKNYGKYLEGLGKEIQSLEDVEGAYKAITKAAMEAAKARMAEKGLSDANEAFARNTGESYKRIYDYMVNIGNYSKEEADNIMLRLRQTIDTGKELPDDIKLLADSFKQTLSTTSPMGWGFSKTVDPVNDAIQSLRKSKKVLDKEVEDIEIKYGKLNAIMSGTGEADAETEYRGTSGTGGEDAEEKLRRQRLKSARDERDAALAALQLFYKQQEQVVNDAYLNREITAVQSEQQLSDIEERYLNSRIAARKVMLGDEGASEEWKKELERMQANNIAHSEENAQALKAISAKNLVQIGQDLRTYGNGEMDGIRKDLEQDRANIQESVIKLRREIEAILTENDFTGIVTRQYMEAMSKLNIFFPEMVEDMQQSAEDAMEGLYEIYPKLFNIDINTDKGLQTFRELLLNTKDISVQMTQQGEEAMRLLYYKTLEYGDAMTEAQKKARERNQKIIDELWRASGGLGREKAMDREGKQIDDTTSQLSRVGLLSEAVANDAEIELYKRRVEAAQEYYNVTKAMNGDIVAAQEKLNSSINELSNALVDKTMRHLETLKSFVDPVEDFGSKLGEAFAMDDAIDRQEAFRDALKDFVGDIGDATKKMIVEWVKQKIQHAITQKAMIKAQKQSQEEMSDASTKGNKDEKKAIEDGGKDALKSMARAAKKRAGLLKEEKKEETDIEKEGQETQTDLVKAGGEIQQAVTGEIGNMITSQKKEQTAENVQTEAKGAQAKTTLGIAEAAANTLGELGWWGIPLVAVITALLNGLLSAAMSKVGSLFGGGKDAGATAPTKLVTGMLTYDEGNVQSVLGSDGQVYSARVGGVNGSGIVSVPTLTNVGGQAALVGEQGPEIVIGRATTRAMMQNNPALLAGLVSFDKMYSGRGFRTYAGGNVQQYGSNGERLSPEEQEALQTQRILSAVTEALAPALESIGAALADSNRTNSALRERLGQPFNLSINKYGRGGLVDEVATGLEQERRNGRNDTVRRLFGSR